MFASKPDDTPVNVCSAVVAQGLCCGCGMCAGVCPSQYLGIQFNAYGELSPCPQPESACSGCGLCLRVCPMSEPSPPTDRIAAELAPQWGQVSPDAVLGSHLRRLAGYSAAAGHRTNGASGGMGTWILEALLTKGLVNAVAAVGPGVIPETGAICGYRWCGTAADVRACAKSAYYPAELSRIIQHIKSHEGRYAVTALPCAVRALRLAMRAVKCLRERIAFIVGLTCGYGMSAFAAEYVCADAGGNPRQLNEITFRIKQNQTPSARVSLIRCVSGQGTDGEHVSLQRSDEAFGKAGGNRWFTRRACDYCDDAFAELADVCLMDAWLPAYLRDVRGNTVVVVRHSAVGALLDDAVAKGDITLADVTRDEAVRSQSPLLWFKRRLIVERIRRARKAHAPLPALRMDLYGDDLSLLETVYARVLMHMRDASPRAWLDSSKDPVAFRRRLRAPSLAAGLLRKLIRKGCRSCGE